MKKILLDMIEKGWRCYKVPDMTYLRLNMDEICEANDVEMILYSDHAICFVKDNYKECIQ